MRRRRVATGQRLGLLLGIIGLLGSSAATVKVVRVGFFQMLNAFDPAIANRYYDFTAPSTNTEYKIQFFYLSQGMRAMAALENGELDVTSSGSSPLSLASARGVDVKTVSLIDIDQLSQGLVTRRTAPDGQPISSPLDLIGKAVSTPYGSTAHFNMLWALEAFSLPYKDHGRQPVLCNRAKNSIDWAVSTDEPSDWQDPSECSPNHVNLFHGSPEKIKHWWDAGLIDGAANWEPTFSYVKDQTKFSKGTNLIETKALSTWGKFTFNCIATTPAFAAAHPALLIRIISIMNLLAMDYRLWTQRVALSSALRQGSLGWEKHTRWVNDTIKVNIAPSTAKDKALWMQQDATENPAAAAISYAVPDRLGLNLVPSLDEQLSTDGCAYMGCGTEGGINRMANEHVSFHYDAKLARKVVSVEPVDATFLEQAALNPGHLDLSQLVAREYDTLPAAPAESEFCGSWAVQEVGGAAVASLSDYIGTRADEFEYPDGKTCVWLLQPKGPFVVDFSFFSLEHGADFVRLFSIADDSSVTLDGATLGHGSEQTYDSQGLDLLGAFTGQELPTAIQSNMPVLLVFKSDFLANAGYRVQRDTGFRASVSPWQCTTAADCNGAQGAGTCNLATGMCECMPGSWGAYCEQRAHCIGTKTLTDVAGMFSHGTAATYQNGADCRWRIDLTALGDTAIELQFTQFSLEAGKDYVSITDTASGILLGRFTGDEVPPLIVSRGNQVVVRLTSDAMAKQTGFTVKYNAVATKCSSNMACGRFGVRCTVGRCLNGEDWRTNLTNTSGVVRAHEAGSASYGNDAQCFWTIEPLADQAAGAIVATELAAVSAKKTICASHKSQHRT
eukprot:g2765.t1